MAGKVPIYKDAGPPSTADRDAHRGLWFQRFFNGYDEQGEWTVSATAKGAFIREVAAAGPCGDSRMLAAHANRRLALVDALGGRSGVFRTSWNFATGLGLSHPVENGLAWHHTLGVPFIAGSGVKGLVRSFAKVWKDLPKEKLLRLFGSPEPGDSAALKRGEFVAGDLIFFDAFPIEPVGLGADVMTPHMGKWYEKGGNLTPPLFGGRDAHEAIPADWHDPVPVKFLVVKDAAMLFSFAPRKAALVPNEELKEIEAILAEALEWVGAGAKTAAGYGRMRPDEEGASKLRRTLDAEKERAAEEKRREDAMKELSPVERDLRVLAEERPNKQEREGTYLFGLWKQSRWEGVDKVEAARLLEPMLRAERKDASKKAKEGIDARLAEIRACLEESKV